MEIMSTQCKEYSMMHLNLKILKNILPLTCLTTVQNYLRTLCKREKINESEKKARRPKFSQIARANGLLKRHKPFEYLPKFGPIIDTANTPCLVFQSFYQTF